VLVSLLFVFVIFLFIAAGDEMLRGLLVECAHHILGRLGPDTDLKRWGLKPSGSTCAGQEVAGPSFRGLSLDELPQRLLGTTNPRPAVRRDQMIEVPVEEPSIGAA